MAVDSAASFVERLKELDLEPYATRFMANGWNTFRQFAVATDWIPGQADIALFESEVVKEVLAKCPEVEDPENKSQLEAKRAWKSA